MIIGFRKRFLFIHVPKCAGESIQQLLLEPANAGGLFLRKHATYADAERVIGSGIADFLAFSVVRNPFEQVVSFYDHLRKPLVMSRDRIERQYPGSGGRLLPHWASELAMGAPFAEFVRTTYGTGPCAAALPQAQWFGDLCSWLEDSSGSIAVRRVLRFERLQVEFESLARELGVEGSLPWRNASGPIEGRAGYRQRYDAEARRIVETRFARTLERFSYDF